MVNIVKGIFSCRHKHISLPFPAVMATPGTSLDLDQSAPVTSDHYVVCLECGKRLLYNWSEMRLVKKTS